MNIQPALSTDTGAHFDLGVDQLANASEISVMADPWLDASGSTSLTMPGAPTQLPQGDLSPWAAQLQLPGV